MESNWTFFSVDVELTNVCGENCSMCPRKSLRRPTGFMTKEVFDRVLVLAYRFSSRITFSGFGNPALHPRWGEYINRVRATGLPAGLVLHPGALDVETIEELRQHPPSHVEISFPSTDPQWFARLCPNSEFVSAVERVEALRLLNVAPMVCVGLEMPGRRESAKEYRDFWKRRGIRSRIFPCHSRGGHLHDRDLLRAKPVHCPSCGLLAVHGFIAWNGEVLACCHDLNGTTRFGSVVDDSPKELASGKAALAALPPWEQCRSCDEFRKGWPLPTGPCPESPGERGRYLAELTKKGGRR